MRKNFIGGNWKMHGNRQELLRLVDELKSQGINELNKIDIAVFPPFVYLSDIQQSLQNMGMTLGAQNQADQEQGAFTGEVSPLMLKDVGCRYVLLGHSERRHIYGESNETVARKLLLANEHQLLPVLCVGETEKERLSGQTEHVIAEQLNAVINLGGIAALQNAVIAYEPVWAIGTGRVATPEEAQIVHAFIRQSLAQHDAQLAEKIRIIYGGSLKPDNAALIFAMPDVDGGLIGGASLKAADFLAICLASAKKEAVLL